MDGEKILELVNKIQENKSANINEAQTKSWIIEPFFEALGWNFRSNNVVPEDSNAIGTRPDYSFKYNGQTKFIVEAKPLTHPLDDKTAQEKINYCHTANIPFLILTNGEKYKIYYSKMEGGIAGKLLKEFTVNSDIKIDELYILEFENFETDLLKHYAEVTYVNSKVKRVLDNLFTSPSKAFISLINGEIRNSLGHGFDEETIKRSLKYVEISLVEEEEEISESKDTYYKDGEIGVGLSQKDSNPKKSRKPYDPMNSLREGKWESTSNLFELLQSSITKNIPNSKCEQTELYFYFALNERQFCQIVPQKRALRVFINIDFNNLSTEEASYFKDVSNIGHWGSGTTQCYIENKSDFDWLLPVLQKSVERH